MNFNVNKGFRENYSVVTTFAYDNYGNITDQDADVNNGLLVTETNNTNYVSVGNYLVPGAGIEPARTFGPRDFKSLLSTSSNTRAEKVKR